MKEKSALNIAIVEDNDWYNKLLRHTISLNPEYNVKSYSDAKSFLKEINTRPDIVTIDFKLPDMDGMELLQHIKSFDENIKVIVISEQDKIATAIDLLRSGAYDYIVKEQNIRNRLLNTINNASKELILKNRIVALEQEVINKYDLGKTVIGNSAAIQNVLKRVEKTLDNNITVIVSGETGTGKEVVAKAIHYNSSRKAKNFVAVNVAAIPSELIESELFGHEKGSFTGAVNRRIGKFEEANGGTLFLDEIGELDMALQAKLLRALQEKEIIRIGSNTPIKFDARIIAATHRNLKDEIKKGAFREDLFYRLMGFPIELPPLRGRGNDVLILARYFIDTFCKENGTTPKSLSETAKNKLMGYHYPGNIRELKSTIELAVVMSNTDEINAHDISFLSDDLNPENISADLTMREYELKILDTYLKKYNHDIKLIAQKLDIGQATIYRMLKEMKK